MINKNLLIAIILCGIIGCKTQEHIAQNQSLEKSENTATIEVINDFYDFEKATQLLYEVGKEKYKTTLEALVDNQKIRLELITINGKTPSDGDLLSDKLYKISPGKQTLIFHAKSITENRQTTMQLTTNIDYKTGHRYIIFGTPETDAKGLWKIYALDYTEKLLIE